MVLHVSGLPVACGHSTESFALPEHPIASIEKQRRNEAPALGLPFVGATGELTMAEDRLAGKRPGFVHPPQIFASLARFRLARARVCHKFLPLWPVFVAQGQESAAAPSSTRARLTPALSSDEAAGQGLSLGFGEQPQPLRFPAPCPEEPLPPASAAAQRPRKGAAAGRVSPSSPPLPGKKGDRSSQLVKIMRLITPDLF